MAIVTQSELEAVAEQIAAECRGEQKKTRRQKVLATWRSKLQKEPVLLEAFQIDRIMREVQTRLAASS